MRDIEEDDEGKILRKRLRRGGPVSGDAVAMQ